MTARIAATPKPTPVAKPKDWRAAAEKTQKELQRLADKIYSKDKK